METKNTINDAPNNPVEISQLALSLDSLIVNGIQFGVFLGITPNDFVQNLSDRLLSDLEALDEPLQTASDPRKAQDALLDLRAQLHRLIDLVTRLQSFRSMPLSELRSLVSQIPPLRHRCLNLIQDLDHCLNGPNPNYHRSSEPPGRSDFFANLEALFDENWKSSRAEQNTSSN